MTAPKSIWISKDICPSCGTDRLQFPCRCLVPIKPEPEPKFDLAQLIADAKKIEQKEEIVWEHNSHEWSTQESAGYFYARLKEASPSQIKNVLLIPPSQTRNGEYLVTWLQAKKKGESQFGGLISKRGRGTE
jgi:hypothetical protein